MSAPTYTITRISDLLTVPEDRRKDCVKEVLLALSLHELALGDDVPPESITWVDDGEAKVGIRDQNDNPLLTVTCEKQPTEGTNPKMRFDPATGEPNPHPNEAEQYRKHHGGVAWIYNPYLDDGNGRPLKRDARDIGSDVLGVLIVPAAPADPYAHLKAAQAAGKKVQFLAEPGGWVDQNAHGWSYMFPPERYRVAPETAPNLDVGTQTHPRVTATLSQPTQSMGTRQQEARATARRITVTDELRAQAHRAIADALTNPGADIKLPGHDVILDAVLAKMVNDILRQTQTKGHTFHTAEGVFVRCGE